ncbi:MAG: molybdopterin-dependent oxidoreductase, partial [Aeromicrobium sp.]
GLTDAWITIACVSNEVGGDLIGNTVWGGVPIKGILEEVGIQAGADALLSTSEDGWTCGTPLDALTDGRNALLALTMNGEPLPVPHGFPVRQVVPGLYGYVSATKWVTDWEVTRFSEFRAFWTDRGWGERGPIKTQSRIDVPGNGSSIDAGSTVVAGVAWAQHVGVTAVEVRIDGGEWQPATLGVAPNTDTWVQWTVEMDVAGGDHTIEARATDATGEPQTDEVVGVLPDGATGYPSVSISAG